MHNIAVHIGVHPTEKRPIDKLLAQLENEPVNVYLVPGVDGHIGQMRAEGFRQGNEPIVSYVDDDDEIIPGIFQKVDDAFQMDIDGLATYEEIIFPDRRPRVVKFPFRYLDPWHFKSIHHIAAFRREAINPYLGDLESMPDGAERSLWAMFLLARKVGCVLPEVGYKWKYGPPKNFGRTQQTEDLERQCIEIGRKQKFISSNPNQARIQPKTHKTRNL